MRKSSDISRKYINTEELYFRFEIHMEHWLLPLKEGNKRLEISPKI